LRIRFASSPTIDPAEQPFTNLPEQECIMSRINGDKSRFNRVRKQNIAKRMRNRALLKNAVAQGKAGVSSSEKKPVVA